MATEKRAIAMCDECGFVYPLRVMRLTSYDTLRCPQCFDGRYDLKNHPQNRAPNVSENPAINNASPDDGGRNAIWSTTGLTWDDDTTQIGRDWDSI